MPILTESQLRRLIQQEILNEVDGAQRVEHPYPDATQQYIDNRWKRFQKSYPSLMKLLDKEVFDAAMFDLLQYQDYRNEAVLMTLLKILEGHFSGHS